MVKFTDVDRILKAIRFLEDHGYIVKKGRANSPTLKKKK